MSRLLSKDRWNEILEVFTSNWVRTLLTAFGVFWGIFILVVLLSAKNGMENGVKRGFAGIATNTIFCWTSPTSMPYKGLNRGRRFRYDLDDVRELKAMPQLQYVSPRHNRSTSVVSKGKEVNSYEIFGDYPEFAFQKSIRISKGRFLNYSDLNKKRKICVIGKGVVEEMYQINDKIIGSDLVIDGVSFKVIGIYYKESTDIEDQKKIFMPFKTFQRIYNKGNTVGWFAITAKDGIPITQLKKEIFAKLKARHQVHPDDNKAIGNFDLYQEYKKILGLFDILTIAGYLIGFLVLISGVIGVSNIMLIVVKERTKELGIRRALGANPWSIRSQIILESAVLTSISGACGVSFATLVVYIVNSIVDADPSPNGFFVNASVDLYTVIIIFIILIMSGILSGLIPARVAIRVRPVEALRVE